MNQEQQFILKKIEDGLAHKNPPEPITKTDLERLNWHAGEFNKIPTSEWNEWSRKMHWALQLAFADDTERHQNKDKINKWRRVCMKIALGGISKPPNEPLVIDSATFHFVQQDLLHIVISVFDRKNLTAQEQYLVTVFSGAAKI